MLQYHINMCDLGYYLNNQSSYLSNKVDKVLGVVLRDRLWYARCDQLCVGHIYLLDALLLLFSTQKFMLS